MIPRIPVPGRLSAVFRRFRRNEDGTAAMELMLVLPLMLTIFMTGIESGYLMTRQILLERATDQVIRDIRLGRFPNPQPLDLKQAICDRSVILVDCVNDLAINMVRVSKTAWNLPVGPVDCVNRIEDMDPSLVANPNLPTEVMVVRVCIVQDAIFPGAGFSLGVLKEGDNGYPLVAVSAFVNEP